MTEIKCTNTKLRRLTRRVGRLYDAEIANAGLKSTQFALLSELKRAGPLRPGKLADCLAMDASTLTRNLKPLEREGWIVMAPGEDGRSRRVMLTAAGETIRLNARNEWARAQAFLRNRLGAKQHERLNQILDEAFAMLDSQGRGDSPQTS